MKKVILVPDSFKGTLTSKEICNIMEATIKKHVPYAEVLSIPVADGGEGTVEAFITAIGGEKVFTKVKGPYFEDMEAYYGRLNETTAVVEMAVCAGLPLVEERRNPMVTTTFGVGQLILKAINDGCKKIIVGLGGSCTNDGGVGAAAALGTVFKNKHGEAFIPTGGTLKEITSIDVSSSKEVLEKVEIITMCDINNPLYGENGAAYIFAPQKGADTEMVKILDDGLIYLCKVINEFLGIDLSTLAGAGAAGGMGAGMIAFMNSKLQMGIDTVLDLVNFEEKLKNTSIVITGEGKLDKQSLQGKVIMGVAKRTKVLDVPLIAIVGAVDEGMEAIYDLGITAVFSINKAPIPFEIAKYNSANNLEFTMENIIRLLKLNP